MHTHTQTVWSNEQQQYTINLWRLYWHWLNWNSPKLWAFERPSTWTKARWRERNFPKCIFFARDGVCVYFEAHHTSQSATQLQQKTILNEVCHRWTNAKTTSKANPSGMVALNPLDIFRYTNVQLIIELEQICLQVISYIKRFLKQKVAKVY